MINPDRIKEKPLNEKIKKILPKTKKQKMKEEIKNLQNSLKENAKEY